MRKIVLFLFPFIIGCGQNKVYQRLTLTDSLLRQEHVDSALQNFVNVTYQKEDASLYYMEAQTWQVPLAPRIQGFKFVKWQVQEGALEDGIILRAVYEVDEPTEMPAVYTNPANPTQKLIRDGNVYILHDDQVYTIQGQRVQ